MIKHDKSSSQFFILTFAGLGAPVYVGDHNCEYTFVWKTYVACLANNK